MNGLFGSGRILPGTGVFADASGAVSRPGFALALIANLNTANAVLAAGASGGSSAAGALARTLAPVLYGGRELAAAMAEPNAPAAEERVRINAIWCPEGTLRKVELCQYQADPRGYGLAVRGG